jgi:Uma2 family endonuclease
MVQPVRQYFTFDEYVRLEEESPIKHEFLDGLVWAMAGGSPEHAALCANIVTLLGTQLRNRRCRVYTSDLRIRVRATGLGTYPDVSVICGQLVLDSEDPKKHTAINPRVLVEVLSPSTEEYDRGEKLSHYQKIDSLEEVALVACNRRAIEVWRKGEGGAWSREEYADDSVARLLSVECELPLVEVYRDPLAEG